MRYKDDYTREEYKQLLDEINILKIELAAKEKEIYNIKFINKLLDDKADDGWRKEIRKIIAEEVKTYSNTLKQYRKPYYKEIVSYVNIGITDINRLAIIINKSESTVRRALQDMNMYPLKKKDFSTLKMNI